MFVRFIAIAQPHVFRAQGSLGFPLGPPASPSLYKRKAPLPMQGASHPGANSQLPGNMGSPIIFNDLLITPSLNEVGIGALCDPRLAPHTHTPRRLDTRRARPVCYLGDEIRPSGRLMGGGVYLLR